MDTKQADQFLWIPLVLLSNRRNENKKKSSAALGGKVSCWEG